MRPAPSRRGGRYPGAEPAIGLSLPPAQLRFQRRGGVSQGTATTITLARRPFQKTDLATAATPSAFGVLRARRCGPPTPPGNRQGRAFSLRGISPRRPFSSQVPERPEARRPTHHPGTAARRARSSLRRVTPLLPLVQDHQQEAGPAPPRSAAGPPRSKRSRRPREGSPRPAHWPGRRAGRCPAASAPPPRNVPPAGRSRGSGPSGTGIPGEWISSIRSQGDLVHFM